MNEMTKRLQDRLATHTRKRGQVAKDRDKLVSRRRAIADAAKASGREQLSVSQDAEARSLTEQIEIHNRELANIDADISAYAERIQELNEQEERAGHVTEGARVIRQAQAHSDATPWLPSRRAYAEMEQEQRATGYSNAGATLLTEAYSSWFDRLRAASVVMAAGPQVIPVPGHALSIPVLTASATVSNYDENTQITASDPTLAGKVLTPVKFAALVNVANESLADSSPELRKIVEDDLVRSIASAVDSAFLVGPGGTGPVKVLGLKNTVSPTAGPNLGTDGGVPDLDDIETMLTSLEAAGANPDTAHFFMSPAIWGVLRRQKAIADGRYHLQPDPSSEARRSLFGVPVSVTANLPQTEAKASSGNVCSTILLADMSRVVVGVGQDVRVQMSEDARFDYDQTSIRVVGRFDLSVLNSTAVVVTVGAKVS